MKTTSRIKPTVLALVVGLITLNASAVSFRPDGDEPHHRGPRFTLLQDKEDCFPGIEAEKIEKLKRLLRRLHHLQDQEQPLDREALQRMITRLHRLRLQCEPTHIRDRVSSQSHCPRDVPDGGSSLLLLGLALLALGALQAQKIKKALVKLRPARARSRVTQPMEDK